MSDAERPEVQRSGATTPAEPHSRRVLRGFLAMSASSFGVMALQLGYAAITSRLLPPTAFGAYAVSLSGIGLIGMLSGSTLGQAVARREHDSVPKDRSLVSIALGLGTVTMVAAAVLAVPWGSLWDAPESASITRILAIGLPFTAVAAVYAGSLRRQGRTTAVAGRTALAQVAGMAVGLAVVAVSKQAWSLGVAATVGAMLSVLSVGSALPRRHITPGRPDLHVLDDVAYGGNSALQSLLRTISMQLTGWSISRFVGAPTLGNFNRAQTLITIPVQRLQTALTFTLFPELRPSGPMLRHRDTFTDLMILVTWPAVILGGVGMFIAPPFVALLLGPGWDEASDMAGYAVLLGVIPLIGVPLGSAVEALGRFRVMTVAWAAQTACIVAGAYGTYSSASPYPAIVGLLGATIIGIPVYGASLVRQGQLLLRQFFRATIAVVGVQACVTVVYLGVSMFLATDEPLVRLVVVVGIAVIELTGLWLIRRRTSFATVASAYRLPGFGKANA